MLINGVNISEYKATLLDRNISPNRVTTNYSWDYTLDRPSFFGSSLDYKDTQLWFKFVCETENEFHVLLSRLSEEFRKSATVKFDDLSPTYTMILKQKAEYTKLNPTTYKVDFVLDSDYGLSSKKVVNGSDTLSITNEGIYSTPVKLTLTIQKATSKLTVTGFERTLEIKDIPANATVIVDGIEGILFINGSNGISKLQSFHLPKLEAGSSIISTNVSCGIVVEYYERY